MGVSTGGGVSVGGETNTTDLELIIHGGPAFEQRLARFRESAALELETKARHKEVVALKAEAETLLADAKRQAAANKAAAAELEIAQQAAAAAEAKFTAKLEKLLAIMRA